MRQLDAWVLAGYTRAAHFAQRTVGWTSYGMAAFCAMGVAVLCGVHLMASPRDFAAPVGVVVWAACSVLMHGADVQFRATPTVLPAAARPLVAGGAVTRLVILCGTVFVVAERVTALALGRALNADDIIAPATLLVTSFYYLGAVTPLPPCQSRLRSWAQAFRAGLREARAEA